MCYLAHIVNGKPKGVMIYGELSSGCRSATSSLVDSLVPVAPCHTLEIIESSAVIRRDVVGLADS